MEAAIASLVEPSETVVMSLFLRDCSCVIAPGHAGMEAAIASLVEPGEKVLIGNNGIWGVRAADIATRYGGARMLAFFVLWSHCSRTQYSTWLLMTHSEIARSGSLHVLAETHVLM